LDFTESEIDAEDINTPASPLSPLRIRGPVSPPRSDVAHPIPLHIESSDSDSDSNFDFISVNYNSAYNHKKTAYMQSNMASGLASVEHPITKHCPLLTAGDISPNMLVDLTDAHNEFFITKEIAEEDKVKKILGGVKDVHIHDWIACNCERLIVLNYTEFMAELRTNYLAPDWEENVHTQILAMQMHKDVKFWDWCQEMRALNIVLRGTDSHLTDTALCNQLEALLKLGLRSYCS